MRESLKQWPWYALVLAAYPLLYIAVTNPGQVAAADVLPVVAAGIAAAALMVALLRPLVGNWATAGLGAAALVLLFYLYGPANEWWLDWVRSSLEQQAAVRTWYRAQPQLAHSIAWAIIAVGCLYWLRRNATRVPHAITGGLNAAAAVLAVLLVVQAGLNQARDDGAAGEAAPKAAEPPPKPDAKPRPDIYFIVLDGYARADILAKYYGFDNAPFLDGLRRRGFQVSDRSRSNFYWTFLSLGSALNFDYVQDVVARQLDPQSRDRTELYRILRDNRAARFLRERGYRFVHLQSTWGGTASNSYADEFLPCHSGIFGNEYLRAVADASWLRALESKASLDVANCHLQNLATLAAQAKAPGPKFVFAHFVPPHHPYLFDRHGNVLRRATMSDQFELQRRLWENRPAYAGQLAFITRRIHEVVGRLLDESPTPPVIILISDHGPNLRSGLDAAEQREVRLANLTAMYLPGAPDGFLPPDATPVNHLRRVFDLYFDAGLPLLPDRYFVSEYQSPFDLTEVGLDNAPLDE
jgi:hypothetical protein